MNCTRCCGLMVVDDLLDLQESYDVDACAAMYHLRKH